MLVDNAGNVIITNDGVTILENMEAPHPAARMAKDLARRQKEEVGDGTTSATLFLSGMIGKGTELIVRGVPVSKIIEGLNDAVSFALREYSAMASPVRLGDTAGLKAVATVAGRGMPDIADLVVRASEIVGEIRLKTPGFKLADSVLLLDRGGCGTLEGVVIDKPPASETMPKVLGDVKVLILDDILDFDRLRDPSMAASAAVLDRQERLLGEHREHVASLVDSGVGLVLLDRGLSDEALEMFTHSGVLAVRRVTRSELFRAAKYTGATPVRLATLLNDPRGADPYLGRADMVSVDEPSATVRIRGGRGEPDATVLISGPIGDLGEELERIARDAASAVQGAVMDGTVPGGGAADLAVSRAVGRERAAVKGMAAYGWEVLCEALKNPVSHMISNSGFNPLEKLEDIISAQELSGCPGLAMDFDTGAIVDMEKGSIKDPLRVRTHALSTAAKVATAILRIHAMVGMRGQAGIALGTDDFR